MKTNKIYKLIFAGIIKSEYSQKKLDIDEEKCFITPDGYVGFIFIKKELPFNCEMIKNTDAKLDLLSVVKPENLLSKTNLYFMTNRQVLTRIFRNKDRKVYINTKFLSYFEDYAELYQAKDIQMCVVVENGQVVGGICPIRVLVEEDEE